MSHYIRSLLFIYIYICSGTIGLSQKDVLSKDIENTKISILTCKSGDELYTTFGHTAIRVSNPIQGIDIVYNYGLFSFDTPNFYPKFLKGELPYYIGATRLDNFLREYNYDKRSVIEQVLDLNNTEKIKTIEYLTENMLPENREYKYDFLLDNCATRVVDVYESLNDKVIYNYEIPAKTFRDLLSENLTNLPWADFGINLLIGARGDKLTTRRDQMFLPEYVRRNLEQTEIRSNDGTRNIVTKERIILDFEKEAKVRESKATNWPLITFSLVLILTVVINFFTSSKIKIIYNNTLLSLVFLISLVILFMMFISSHSATKDNYNILWMSPLALVFVFWRSRKLSFYLGYVMLFFATISALNCIVQVLPQQFSISFLPLILAIGIAIYNNSIANHSKVKTA